MKNKLKYSTLVMALALFLVLQSCQAPSGNSTGSEYMPDMAHSIAYEANYYNYYYNNTWGTREEYHKYAQPKLPVSGTVPRSVNAESGAPSVIPLSGSVPYYYGNTEEERTRAISDIVNNPYPITDTGLATGKDLYNTFCGICHGEKGDGLGYLVRDDGGVYPNAPANFLLPEHLSASNGRYYHAIMHGKNVMGAYKDKLSYEERWQVIHWIRALQAKELKLDYNQMVNTLNTVDQPAGEMAAVVNAPVHYDYGYESHGDGHGGHHSDDAQGHDTDHHGSDEHKVQDGHGDEHSHGHDNDDHKDGDHH